MGLVFSMFIMQQYLLKRIEKEIRENNLSEKSAMSGNIYYNHYSKKFSTLSKRISSPKCWDKLKNIFFIMLEDVFCEFSTNFIAYLLTELMLWGN